MSDKSGHQDVTALNIIGLLNTQFAVIAKTKAPRFLLTTSSKANSSCKASGCSAAKQFPAFYKARKFITIFIRVCHCVISLISRIHYTHYKKIRFNIILPSIAMFTSPLLVSSLHAYNQRFVHILHLSLHGVCSGHASSHKNVFTAAANGMTTSLSPTIFTTTISLSKQHDWNNNVKFRGHDEKIHTELECHRAMVISQTNPASLHLAETHILLKEDPQLF